MPDHIPINRWGRDHWSTLAYLETRIVGHRGVIQREHMRCDPALHPHLAHEGSRMGSPAPTRLADGEVSSHDDWSCLDDAEAEGLIQNVGTGLYRRYVLTDKGRPVAHARRPTDDQSEATAATAHRHPWRASTLQTDGAARRLGRSH